MVKIEKGVISDWRDEKGFGFITPSSGGKRLFFHVNDYSYRHKRPVKNLKVQYLSSTDKKGRRCAVDVVPIKGHKSNNFELRQKIFSLTLVGGFFTILYLLHQSEIIPVDIIYLYAGMSVAAFLMYAKDKNAAKVGEWRTAEDTLHVLSMLGGWPGAKIAQSFLRHKSKKMSFKVTYWITVGMNCGALYWLTTPAGGGWLNTILKNIHGYG